ncbi:MAG TPA: LamG-like jellyroll fold domain-containing protein [Bacteroidales bacterium]|nr:LamG-like jellyroll fold domain-containing protein [Bacteroidales bacterium]
MKKLNFLFTISLIMGLVVSLYGQTDPGSENLTHSWRFEDFTADDAIGDAHGELVGNGIVGGGDFQALSFGQYIELPTDKIAINTYPAITLEVWYTATGTDNPTHHMLCYFGNSTDNGSGTFVGSDGYFISPYRVDDSCRTAISCGNTTQPWTAENGVSTPELTDNVMHHIVSTLNATEIGMYVDGVLVSTAALTGTNSIANISTEHAWLMESGYALDSTVVGKLHECNMYNKVLTADEVAFQYARGPATVTSVADHIASRFQLSQNFPNPFNLSTKITYSIARTSDVKLSVYNVMGQEVAVLVNKTMNPGDYSVTFNGKDCSSGIYFYQLRVGDQIITKRMMLTR